jgi:hypothetical protein
MTPTACQGPTVAVLEVDPREDLSAPGLRQRALDTLEGGGVVVLPGRGFELTPDESTLITDTRRMLRGIQEEETRNGRPTILYEPWRGRIKRAHFASVDGKIVRGRVSRAATPQVTAMMARFASWAEELTGSLFPRYRTVLAQDRVTYRPHGRRSTQGLHIDSAYDYPTQGRGMLRLFCNIDPGGKPRVWQVGEPYLPFVERFLPHVSPREPGATSRFLRSLGVVRGAKTRYDLLVADLRRCGKSDREYQATAPRRIVEFPSGTCWFAITDLVLHGAVSGQQSLDQTWFLPPEAMEKPQHSSLRILERLTGRALV